MLQQETRCEVADNSGAKIAYVIRVYGGSTATGAFTRRVAHVGDRVFVSIKKALAGADVKEGDKAKATSTSHRNKLQKEQTDLKKQQAELLTFEEKLKHAADQKLSLDLDDGVKVNYAKFGDLLAESKAITGGKDDD